MERLRFERPTLERKDDAIEFINEFYEYNSSIHGVGSLARYLDNYDGWLLKLEEDWHREPSEEKVPAETYFLVRESDNRIVGMINIRLALNERLKKYGGHIGYSIRPTERQKGYNKVNLYLALLVCQEHGIKEVFMDCDKSNPASARTMLAFGANFIREWYCEEDQEIIQDYTIDVDEAIKNNKDIYEPKVYRKTTH